MTTAFILLAIGFLLIFIEFFLPGGIIGIAGALLVLASMVIFATQSTSILAIAFYVIGSCVALIFLIKLALWRIRNAPPGYSVYLGEDQEGYYASEFDTEAIGKEGTVQTDLRPGGYILIDGKKHQALCKSGYAKKGETVIVIGGEEESLIVKQKKEIS